MKPSNYLKICKTYQGDKDSGHHMVGIKWHIFVVAQKYL